jgi:GMP synthase-like glutamine amidotransferase
VPKGIPQHPQVEHLPLQIICLGMQLIAGNVGPAVLPEHAGDLGEGEACRLPEFDQG